jgi:pimeloyl-ACP methyl ester carboxylesterase
MRSALVLILLMVFAFRLSAQIADGGQTMLDEPAMKAVYQQAKRDFTNFERNHGAFVQTKNVKMHYLRWGNPADPCLIWAHGSMNSAYELKHVADSLAKAGFYVLAIDYYGHGQTPFPEQEVSLYHVADDIRYLMDHLSIERAFIGGFSRGGYIATAFYDSYPDRVLGLILEDGGSVAANTYFHQMSSEALEGKALDFTDSGDSPWAAIFESEFDAFKALYAIDGDQTDFSVYSLIKEVEGEKWSIIYSEMPSLFHLASPAQFLDLTLRPTLAPLFARSMVMMEPAVVFRNLDIPVLVLDPVSDHDSMPFEKENRALKSQHPGLVDYVLYEDTGHNIHYEHPERFTADVLRFMKKALN